MFQGFKNKIKTWSGRNAAVRFVVDQVQEARFNWLYKRYYTNRGSQKKASTLEINLEFASQCNLRCKFCALDHEKPHVQMSEEVLDTLMNTLLNDERFSRVERLNLYNGGETLLHPKRLEMLRNIAAYREKFISKGKRFPKVVMLTNGMLLRPALSDSIIEERLVDVMKFSLDGGTPESFEEMRVNAKWKLFYSNVKYFAEKAKSQGIQCAGITIVPDELPLKTSWMHPEFREIIELLSDYELRRLHNWGGAIDIAKKKRWKKGCNMLLDLMVLLPNGDVTICCNDLNSLGVTGNILENSLFELYQSEERLRHVELLKQGRKSELLLCAECETY
jgi:sulfatase maturation enzyme AslB (radical SAM superfamily)